MSISNELEKLATLKAEGKISQADYDAGVKAVTTTSQPAPPDGIDDRARKEIETLRGHLESGRMNQAEFDAAKKQSIKASRERELGRLAKKVVFIALIAYIAIQIASVIL